MEAATSIPESEVAAQATTTADPVETNDTAPVETEVTTDTESATSTDVGTDDDFQVAYDLNTVPEKVRNEVKKHVEKIEKDFKRAYTKKTQTLAEERAQQGQELQKQQQLNSEWTRVAREVLSDPTKYEAYRRMYGTEAATAAAGGVPPGVETVGDLVNYYETQLKTTANSLRGEVDVKVQQQIREHQQMQRWDNAVNTMRQDPRFKKWEGLVTQIAATDPAIRQVYKGSNEQDVLNAAWDKFKAQLRDDMEEVKKSTLQQVSAKKAATTALPRKTVTSDNQHSGKLSVQEMISRANARLSGG